ncbi:beta-lactamase family protein [Hymenobacter sp. 15J16-1T3B]|uniref:serine hydrolase domain-containing protein n=1 Tax=Hymenobacter sp. 15J16-1T3B TaxID=2886941 RepID=UPI001D12843F|nr:serine hydrolase domain-containing protein [Hymenobacter sp. 15J16-1T3B]MCC3156255.1 beta-lactamase family protein [Hymenobacter sp. 15J16-1T3B]
MLNSLVLLRRLLFLVLLGALPAAANAARPDSVDAFMQRAMRRHHIPGAAVAVVRGGQVLKLQAYGSGSLTWQAPATPHTAFQLASATKPMTGTLLAVLAQAGRLRLDAPIGTYLDSVPAAWQSITVRELAAHQSGIGLVPLETTRDTRHALRTAAARPLEYAPGTKDFYVSTDYALLQAIVERVTGQPFAEALRHWVLEPLRMTNTGFNHAQDGGLIRTARVLPQASEVYSWDAAAGAYRLSDMRFPDWFAAAGGIYASVQDLANWLVGLDRHTLLKPEYEALLWAPARLRNQQPTHFGLGMVHETYQGHQLVGHSGGPALADIVRFADPNQAPLSVVVLTNTRGGFPPYLAKAVAHYFVPGLQQDRPENYH